MEKSARIFPYFQSSAVLTRGNYQLSIINYQLSIINYQLSIINYSLSIIHYQKYHLVFYLLGVR